MTIAAPALSATHEVDAPKWLRADALCVAGFASLGAGAIHAAATGAHNEHDQAVLLFTAVAAFQLLWGVLAVARTGRGLAVIGALGNLGLVGGWVLAKTRGIDFINGLEAKEPIEFGDGLAAAFAAIAVVLAVSSLRRAKRAPQITRRIAASVASIAIVILALPGMSSAARPGHGHGAEVTTAGHGHDGGAATGTAAGTKSDAGHAQAVAPVPYDPKKPIDLGGVPGVTLVQQARAENLIAASLIGLPKYTDPAVAELAGFRSIHDGVTGYEHYIHREYMADGRVLDPERPESLVYQVRDGKKQLVAAMYMAEPGTTLQTTPELGGKLTQWHIHDNLCFTPAGQVAGLTSADGTCSPGLVKPEAVPMIHVWIVKHQCGPFAALEGIAGGSIKSGEQRLCDVAHGAH